MEDPTEIETGTMLSIYINKMYREWDFVRDYVETYVVSVDVYSCLV